jgi:hypothetical protein
VNGLRLYWANNDGMSGHVFLSPGELFELAREMQAQDLPGLELRPGARIPPGILDAALGRASANPRAVEDEKLWHDWLAFLGGAVENGGLVVR